MEKAFLAVRNWESEHLANAKVYRRYDYTKFIGGLPIILGAHLHRFKSQVEEPWDVYSDVWKDAVEESKKELDSPDALVNFLPSTSFFSVSLWRDELGEEKSGVFEIYTISATLDDLKQMQEAFKTAKVGETVGSYKITAVSTAPVELRVGDGKERLHAFVALEGTVNVRKEGTEEKAYPVMELQVDPTKVTVFEVSERSTSDLVKFKSALEDLKEAPVEEEEETIEVATEEGEEITVEPEVAEALREEGEEGVITEEAIEALRERKEREEEEEEEETWRDLMEYLGEHDIDLLLRKFCETASRRIHQVIRKTLQKTT